MLSIYDFEKIDEGIIISSRYNEQIGRRCDIFRWNFQQKSGITILFQKPIDPLISNLEIEINDFNKGEGELGDWKQYIGDGILYVKNVSNSEWGEYNFVIVKSG